MMRFLKANDKAQPRRARHGAEINHQRPTRGVGLSDLLGSFMEISDASWVAVCEFLSDLEKQSKRFDAATNGLMIAPESPLRDPFFRICDAAISACSKLIGDEFEHISWYVFECEFGASPKDAGCKSDMRMIDSLEKLRWLIELD